MPRTRFVSSIRRAALPNGSSPASVSTSARRSRGRFFLGTSGVALVVAGLDRSGAARARHVTSETGEPTWHSAALSRSRSPVGAARARTTSDHRTTDTATSSVSGGRGLEHVNGFDMRLGGWDGEDVDIAHRLLAAGLRCGWPGPGSSVLHLWHAYRKQAERVPRLDGIEATYGLSQLARSWLRLRDGEPGGRV